jgi:hypothetical protein
MDYSKLSDSEKSAFHMGQEIVIDEILIYIAELGESRNPLSSYGKGQLYILSELVRKIAE